MASKSTTIKVNITGDARDALKAINQTTGEMMTMQQKTSTAVSGMANAIASSAVVGKITEIGKAAIDAAADLEQSIGGVDTVFKDVSAQVHAWAEDAAQTLGLSQNSYNELATVIGSQLKNAGMSMDDVAGKTNDLITLGADLSSMFGGTTTQAVEALSSALKGEMDPIEAYGVSLNDATLKAQAASMGLGDLYAAGDRNAKMQATLAAITQQTGDATGNFGKEADTAQGQQQRLNAMWENAQAALGQQLLPVVTAVTQKLTEMVSWVQQNSAWLTPLAVVVGVVAAAIIGVNAAMSAYAAVAAIVAVAQGAVNVAFLPVAAIIAAIVAAIVLLAANWETVKSVAMRCAQAISDKWNEFKTWFGGIVDSIANTGKAVWDKIAAPAKTAVDRIGGFFNGLKDSVLGVFDDIVGAIKGAWDWVTGLWDKITGASNAAASVSAQASGASMEPVAYAAYQPARAVSLMSRTRPAGVASRAVAAWSASSQTRPTVREDHVTINVRFDGLVTDPEAVAREIRKITRDYDRKRGNR
ncbi:tape measure protein [Bifidobacterium lemurum]|uniref:Tape measure protein n=1 Tax=Bifidobacterium lemurum TaxID=1603886 RepID=A0A261FU26_9BIFI|nr:phage tail tape measure protein [Bifidobacterium lemurum]OZG62691.1 tape measure protein [Bifidobacterium lemurum]QOL34592.1 phage tail tape measure protein [Bifidobacterium lemurum]